MQGRWSRECQAEVIGAVEALDMALFVADVADGLVGELDHVFPLALIASANPCTS